MRALDIGQTVQLARVWRIPPGVATAETRVRVLEMLHFRKQRGINRPESRVRVVIEDVSSPANGFEGWLDWGMLAPCSPIIAAAAHDLAVLQAYKAQQS